MTIRPPLILVVGNSQQASALRVPTLKQKLAAGKRQIKTLTINELAAGKPLPGEAKLCQLIRQENQRAGVIIDGISAADKAQQLYQRYLQPRLS
ncbi:hypothetical protein D3C73_1349440 [compost metagenome]